ncbi:uncharacterized protein LOC126631058 [Malus sylvestris]|uniref:uncharacterized protein LOC126631058 n=1 Tax=Malus sylvestris TaxID=3752 RepID=UPI0021AC63F9|nr:uncharacterized protein LOC126631058 [Malus sylvestris]
MEHMFFLCPLVESVWFGEQLNYKVIHKIRCAYAAFMEATKRTQRAISGMRTSSDNHGNLEGNSQPIYAWSPLDRSLFKVNVDTSWNATTKKGNVAIVIRDLNGKFVAARKLCISASSVQVAEAKAILEGCMPAKNLELDKIIMESDSKEVILSLCDSTFNGRI